MPNEQHFQYLALNIDFTVEEKTGQLKLFEWGYGFLAGYAAYRLVSSTLMYEKFFRHC